MAVRALRGATTVEEDTSAQIAKATAELMQTMFDRNGINRADIISIIFTATPDLTSDFPATAVRAMGVSDVPLLCASEIDVKGAIPRVIRVMMHLNSETPPSGIHHVYLHDAKPLRTDLPQ